MKGVFWISAFFILFGSACGNFDYSGKGKDIPTAGELELWVDHGDSLLFTQLKDLFEANYPKSNIKLIYASEIEILKAVNDGKCRACVMHRNFDTLEKTALENRDFKVRSIKIGTTSTAFLVNIQNPVAEISLQDLGKILSMENSPGGYFKQVIFDKAGGANFRQVSDFFGKRNVKIKTGGIRSLPSPESVLRWLELNADAVGVVNLNLIADRSDSSASRWLNNLRVLKVQSHTDSSFAYPFQSQMAAGQYPFVSDIYFHDLQGYSGLASGFVAWIYSQPGQTIIKKSGLLPARDMGRTIEISTEY